MGGVRAWLTVARMNFYPNTWIAGVGQRSSDNRGWTVVSTVSTILKGSMFTIVCDLWHLTIHVLPHLFTDFLSTFPLQYNKQHVLPLKDVKLQSLENDGRKFVKVVVTFN